MTKLKLQPKFIWPEAKFSSLSFFKKTHSDTVEAELKTLYPNVFPVLFSSARAGLVNLLIFLKANKLTNVWTPLYSSHCVLESISRIGFPCSDILNAQISVVYHQWGYKQEYSSQNQIIIEDSADSFFLPGDIIFPNDGNFQLVSLPKSLGCYGGGILLCKSEEDAQMIRKIRNTKINNTYLHFLLKLLGRHNKQLYFYWDSFESALGYPPNLLCTDVLNKMEKIDLFVKQIKDNIRTFKAEGIYSEENTLPDRLPCAIPFQNFQNLTNTVGNSIKEYRMFNTSYCYNNTHFEKVLPIPIHKDINKLFIEQFLRNVHNPIS